MTNIERFFSKISKTNYCWNWTGTTLRKDRGQFWDGTKRVYSARFSYEIHIGKIPYGYIICHKCDNPKCVNPDHLYAGTYQDNVNDRENRNRSNRRVGVENGASKLNPDKVRLIRQMPISKAANQFNVCRTTIKNIKNFKVWAHVI